VKNLSFWPIVRTLIFLKIFLNLFQALWVRILLNLNERLVENDKFVGRNLKNYTMGRNIIKSEYLTGGAGYRETMIFSETGWKLDMWQKKFSIETYPLKTLCEAPGLVESGALRK
jgi:hypothetical protein